MMNRSLFGLLLALTGCATAANEGRLRTPVQFQGPSAAASLPHRSVQGARAAEVFDALRAALPPQETYDVESLSCVHVSYPGQTSTHCQVGPIPISDQSKAENLLAAVHDAGAKIDMLNKMPRVVARNVHSTRDSLAFDDEANVKRARVQNVRLTGKPAEDVMAAIGTAGVKEDDGTLFIVCHRFEGEADPTCGYTLHRAVGPKLDRAQSLALWTAFVHDPKITLLNAGGFVFDGEALSFVGTLASVQPPPPPT
jgi:hypothetical protein